MTPAPIQKNTLFYGDNLQILTIEQLLDGAGVQMPPAYAAFKQAQRVKKDDAVQGELEL